MREIHNLTIEDYLNIVQMAKENGVKPGESMEKYIIKYTKDNNINPVGHTELNDSEYLSELKSKGLKTINLKDLK